MQDTDEILENYENLFDLLWRSTVNYDREGLDEYHLDLMFEKLAELQPEMLTVFIQLLQIGPRTDHSEGFFVAKKLVERHCIKLGMEKNSKAEKRSKKQRDLADQFCSASIFKNYSACFINSNFFTPRFLYLAGKKRILIEWLQFLKNSYSPEKDELMPAPYGRNREQLKYFSRALEEDKRLLLLNILKPLSTTRYGFILPGLFEYVERLLIAENLVGENWQEQPLTDEAGVLLEYCLLDRELEVAQLELGGIDKQRISVFGRKELLNTLSDEDDNVEKQIKEKPFKLSSDFGWFYALLAALGLIYYLVF